MRILFKTIKRTPLTVLLFLLTAFSAAAQFPTRTVFHYPTVQPPAEIRFMDGRVDHYAIKRIAKDVMRVDLGGDQSTRIPLTVVESIRFQDGCTLYFDGGELQFDRLVQPAWLKNEAGDAVLEGVLKLSGPQAESLMGPDLYRQFRKHSGLTLAGSITMATGVLMLVPYMGQTVSFIAGGEKARRVQSHASARQGGYHRRRHRNPGRPGHLHHRQPGRQPGRRHL